MTKLEGYLADYSGYHVTKGNKLYHYLGIPLIVFSTFGLLASVPLGSGIDLGLIAWLLSSVYYCRLELKRGLLFSVLTFIVYWASMFVTLPIHWGLFIFGWILQGIGHYVYEKRSPAFLKNLSHLLIGPFWIFCNFVGGTKPKA